MHQRGVDVRDDFHPIAFGLSDSPVFFFHPRHFRVLTFFDASKSSTTDVCQILEKHFPRRSEIQLFSKLRAFDAKPESPVVAKFEMNDVTNWQISDVIRNASQRLRY